jgi:hypothetical protein
LEILFEGEKGELPKKMIVSPNLSTQSFKVFAYPPFKEP